MKLVKVETSMIALSEAEAAGAARALWNFENDTKPVGSFDNAKRFYPATKCACCSGIRSPSRAWPFSLLHHARTLEHRAQEEGATAEGARTVRAALKRSDIEIVKLPSAEAAGKAAEQLHQRLKAMSEAAELQALATDAARERLAEAKMRNVASRAALASRMTPITVPNVPRLSRPSL